MQQEKTTHYMSMIQQEQKLMHHSSLLYNQLQKNRTNLKLTLVLYRTKAAIQKFHFQIEAKQLYYHPKHQKILNYTNQNLQFHY